MKCAKRYFAFAGAILWMDLFFAQCGLGQSISNTASGGIIERAGIQEPYGINNMSEAVIGGNEIKVPGQGEYLTRDYRRGNESGIGSSFMQTNSPTNQSSPARRRQEISPIIQEIAPLPNVLRARSIYGNSEATPALRGEEGVQSQPPGLMSPALTSKINLSFPGENLDSSLFGKSTKINLPMDQLNMHKTTGASSPEFFFPKP